MNNCDGVLNSLFPNTYTVIPMEGAALRRGAYSCNDEGSQFLSP